MDNKSAREPRKLMRAMQDRLERMEWHLEKKQHPIKDFGKTTSDNPDTQAAGVISVSGYPDQ